MKELYNVPRALFLFQHGEVHPDSLVCSGILPSVLNGKPCPYSDNGRIPPPAPLDIRDDSYSIDKGKPGDLCPPCAKQQMSSLGHWQTGANRVPPHLSNLRLFKCRQWFWFVIPGLRDSNPTNILYD